MSPANLVRVKRTGGRGWHLIAREKYEAAPDTYVVVDDEADRARDEEAKRLKREAEGGTAMPIAEAESAAEAVSEPQSADTASATPALPMAVAKGPRGLFFVKAGAALLSNGFATEEEANAAMAELAAGGSQ